MAQKKNKQKNSVRIISGQWRSRRISFLDKPDVRPTPDRVRETLFNWLGDTIAGARCLDLFAGSGALGFEAASRGAAHVTLVDTDLAICKMLAEQKTLLQATQIDIVQQEALSYLQNATVKFDLLFIDPPFACELYNDVLATLLSRQLITHNSLLYIESAAQQGVAQIDLKKVYKLSTIREKTAGEVHFGLYQATTI